MSMPKNDKKSNAVVTAFNSLNPIEKIAVLATIGSAAVLTGAKNPNTLKAAAIGEIAGLTTLARQSGRSSSHKPGNHG